MAAPEHWVSIAGLALIALGIVVDASFELWLTIAGALSVGSGIVHWFRPFLTHRRSVLEVDMERISRFELVVGRIMAICLVFFGLVLFSLSLPRVIP